VKLYLYVWAIIFNFFLKKKTKLIFPLSLSILKVIISAAATTMITTTATTMITTPPSAVAVSRLI